MASAKTKVIKKEIVVTKTIDKKIVNLEMTELEAEVLATVLRYIGGHDEYTARGSCLNIAQALQDAGIKPYYGYGHDSRSMIEGIGLYFKHDTKWVEDNAK